VNYHYTPAELKELLSLITIIVDTREQENSHITDYFTKKKIPFISQKLDYGDYSCYLPQNEPLGIMRDLYFSNDIACERKHSLDELANNLTADRTRFESELIHANKCKLLLMIENASYSDIVAHNYRSRYEPKSFIATLASFTARYDLNINFISQATVGNFIYYNLLYHTRNFLLGR